MKKKKKCVNIFVMMICLLPISMPSIILLSCYSGIWTVDSLCNHVVELSCYLEMYTRSMAHQMLTMFLLRAHVECLQYYWNLSICARFYWMPPPAIEHLSIIYVRINIDKCVCKHSLNCLNQYNIYFFRTSPATASICSSVGFCLRHFAFVILIVFPLSLLTKQSLCLSNQSTHTKKIHGPIKASTFHIGKQRRKMCLIFFLARFKLIFEYLSTVTVGFYAFLNFIHIYTMY